MKDWGKNNYKVVSNCNMGEAGGIEVNENIIKPPGQEIKEGAVKPPIILSTEEQELIKEYRKKPDGKAFLKALVGEKDESGIPANGKDKIEPVSGKGKETVEPLVEEKRCSVKRAEKILGDDFYGAEAVGKFFGVGYSSLEKNYQFPSTEDEVKRARDLGQVLILHLGGTSPTGGPSIQDVHEEKIFNALKMGYKVKDLKKEGRVLENNDLKLEDFNKKKIRPGWAFVSKEPIPGSTGVNYYKQTEVLADYVKNIVYKDRKLPDDCREAIEEFEEFKTQNPDIENKLSSEEVSEKLSKLKVNQNYRQTAAEALYDGQIVLKAGGVRLHEGKYAWTSDRISDSKVDSIVNGNFVALDSGSEGHRVDVIDLPSGGSHEDLGVVYIRVEEALMPKKSEDVSMSMPQEKIGKEKIFIAKETVEKKGSSVRPGSENEELYRLKEEKDKKEQERIKWGEKQREERDREFREARGNKEREVRELKKKKIAKITRRTQNGESLEDVLKDIQGKEIDEIEPINLSDRDKVLKPAEIGKFSMKHMIDPSVIKFKEEEKQRQWGKIPEIAAMIKLGVPMEDALDEFSFDGHYMQESRRGQEAWKKRIETAREIQARVNKGELFVNVIRELKEKDIDGMQITDFLDSEKVTKIVEPIGTAKRIEAGELKEDVLDDLKMLEKQRIEIIINENKSKMKTGKSTDAASILLLFTENGEERFKESERDRSLGNKLWKGIEEAAGKAGSVIQDATDLIFGWTE